MRQGKAYDILKALIDNKRVQKFRQIFIYLPKTVVAKDLGMDPRTLTNHLNDLGGLTLKEIDRLAMLTDVDAMELFKMAHEEYKENTGKKKKSGTK